MLETRRIGPNLTCQAHLWSHDNSPGFEIVPRRGLVLFGWTSKFPHFLEVRTERAWFFFGNQHQVGHFWDSCWGRFWGWTFCWIDQFMAQGMCPLSRSATLEWRNWFSAWDFWDTTGQNWQDRNLTRWFCGRFNHRLLDHNWRADYTEAKRRWVGTDDCTSRLGWAAEAWWKPPSDHFHARHEALDGTWNVERDQVWWEGAAFGVDSFSFFNLFFLHFSTLPTKSFSFFSTFSESGRDVRWMCSPTPWSFTRSFAGKCHLKKKNPPMWGSILWLVPLV